jgi:hypothetical protein
MRTGLRRMQTGLGQAHGRIPEIGNSRLETGLPIGAPGDHSRRSPISASAKPCGMRASAPVMAKSPISGNAWLTTQFARTGLGRSNSLLTGKRTGNFSFSGHFRENCRRKRTYFQCVTNKFPKNRSREIIRQSRERFPGEQGIITANGSLRRRCDFAPFRIVRVYLMYPGHRDAGA